MKSWIEVMKLVLLASMVLLILSLAYGTHTATKHFDSTATEVRSYLYSTNINLNKNLNTLNDGMDANLKELKNAVRSWHGVSFDIRKNFTSNQDRIAAMQEKTLSTFDTLNQGLASTMNIVGTKVGPLLDNTNGLITDLRFAIPVLTQDIHEMIQEIRGSVALVINDKLVGLLDVTSKNIDEIGQEVRKLFPTAKITIEQINQLVGTVDQIAFFLAKIVEDGSEVSEHYKNKLLHPSKWERFKAVMNMVLYAGGNVIAPWLITQKVTIVK